MAEFKEIWDAERMVRLGVLAQPIRVFSHKYFATAIEPMRPVQVAPAQPFPGNDALDPRYISRRIRTLNLDITQIVNAHCYDGTEPLTTDERVYVAARSYDMPDYEYFRTIGYYDTGNVADYQAWLSMLTDMVPYFEQHGWQAEDPRESYLIYCENAGKVPAGHNLRTSAPAVAQSAAARIWAALEGFVDVDQDECFRAAERLMASTSPNIRSQSRAVSDLIAQCRNIQRTLFVPMFGRQLYNTDFRSVERNTGIPPSAARILGGYAEPDDVAWDDENRNMGPWTGGVTPVQPVASGPKRYVIHPVQPGKRAINLEG